MAQRKMTQAQQRALEIYARLEETYPDVRCTLNYQNPLQLLIMTILAAQCTDARVNIVAQTLFQKYKTPQDFLDVPIEELQEDIRSTGFFRQKAKSIQATCRDLIEHHDGQVPDTMSALLKLRGVGRKTANVLLGECFHTPGVVVDTHCKRLANRLGFTREQDPKKIELVLMKLWPHNTWSRYSHFMVFHGRATCTARAPQCSECILRDLCPFPNTRKGKEIAK